ncbi:MAG TPA: hypothetical protein DDZ74_23315 [Pseudomonas sp.]|nr:hypothetical protein [Pseudomonas sp.]
MPALFVGSPGLLCTRFAGKPAPTLIGVQPVARRARTRVGAGLPAKRPLQVQKSRQKRRLHLISPVAEQSFSPAQGRTAAVIPGQAAQRA